MAQYPSLKPFVVHGHDHAFRDAIVSYLRVDLGMDPVVLDGVASAGRTVIEKFEDESAKCNLAVVLLTPDDAALTMAGTTYMTARPNVWIELGYFIAAFGRKSGRTLLIYKKGLDIPTDLFGVVYLDATTGFSDPDVARRLETELNAIVSAVPSTSAPSPGPSPAQYRISGTVRLSAP
ncbi:MAG: TIR domain-containing protein [Fimbriimonas sp.]